MTTHKKSYPPRISETSTTESSGRYSLISPLVRRSTKPPKLIGVQREEENNGASSVEQIKNMLRGGWPRLNTTGIDYDVFVESISERKQIPGKNVLILSTKFGLFAFTKKPAEALMDKDPSLIDIGCSSSGKNRIVIPTSAYMYYIAKIEKNGAKKPEKEQELDLDVDIEISGDPEFDRVSQFLINLDKSEVDNIVAYAEFKKYKRIAQKIVKTEVKRDQCDPPLPYLKAESEDGRVFLIYLVEERNLEAKKTGSEEESGVKNRYSLPKVSDSCVKVDAGTHQYAVLVPDL